MSRDDLKVADPWDEWRYLDWTEASASGTDTITKGTTDAGGARGLVDSDDNSNLVFTKQYFFGVADGQDFDQVPTADGFLDASNFQVTLPAEAY